MKNLNTICLIVCCGIGSRIKREVPKQYLDMKGKPVIYHTISKFLKHKNIDAVALVINNDYRKLYYDSIKGLPVDGKRLLFPVLGGAERQDSVRQGLIYLKNFSPEKVIIHDGVRPFISDTIITKVVENIKPGQAVLPVVSISDTIKRCNNSYVEETVDRNKFYGAQTPQGFMFEEILELHIKHKYNTKVTDDVSLFEMSQKDVLCVDGCKSNIKITTEDDLKYVM